MANRNPAIRTAFFAAAFFAAATAAADTWYPAEDWQDTPDPIASPHAKKGGTVRFSGGQGPKSYNGYIDGNTYTMMTFSLMFETLLGTDTETLDFVPGLARRWCVSDDGETFTFVIDDNARWSDGVKLDAYDVKWTFDAIMDEKNDTGAWKVILAMFESPEVIDEKTVRFTKKPGAEADWRDLQHCGFFYILPRHYFEGKDFNKVDLLGCPVSGPYRLSRIEEQVESEWSRNRDWWRKDMPSCKYICNFDRIVLRYYVDNENAFEALKKRAIDVYPVYTARIMSAETHGEKFDRNWILKRRVANHAPIGFQGFAMNMRKKPFDDVRVRKAMAHLIDRETMNRTMMFGEYFLLKSTYTDLYDAVHPCENPYFEYNVEKAKELLKEAGYERGFKFTFLSRSGTEDKFLALFNHALRQCNIEMEITRKDFAGWMRDMDAFNFEMTWASWGASIFRTPETQWLSSEADRKGSNNFVGFKSAAVDELIRREKGMKTMAERADAYRAIDRLVCEQVPYAFLWNTADKRILYWNKFGMPSTVMSRYGDEDSVLSYWWYDDDKAEELKDAMANHTCLPDVPLKVEFDEMLGKEE